MAIALAVGVFCVSCPITTPFKDKPDDRGPSPYDEEDRLSRHSINQPIVKPAGWKKIAQNTGSFQLSKQYTYTRNWVDAYGTKVIVQYSGSYGTFPAIDGSTVLLPLAVEFGWQYFDLSDDQTAGFFDFSTTHNAFIKLIGADQYNNDTYGYFEEFLGWYENALYYNGFNFRKQPDIIFITSPSVEEIAIANSRGVALTVKPVCYDSFVFITHTANPVDTLTAEQIRGIYSGKIKNWSEVGGANEEIVAFQREAGSGSQTAMEEIVMGGINMMKAPVGWYASSMGRLIEFVAEYQNESKSIGYTFKYYVDRLYKNPNIKIIKVNGVEPNDDNVQNKTYPFIASYNGIIRTNDSSSTGGRFLDWMLSEEGQRCIAQAGYVPVTR